MEKENEEKKEEEEAERAHRGNDLSSICNIALRRGGGAMGCLGISGRLRGCKCVCVCVCVCMCVRVFFDIFVQLIVRRAFYVY